MTAAQTTDRSSALENTPALPEFPPIILRAIGSWTWAMSGFPSAWTSVGAQSPANSAELLAAGV